MQQLDADTGALIRTWPSCDVASRAFGGGLSQSISLVARHGVESAGGFRWRFASADDGAAAGEAAAAAGHTSEEDADNDTAAPGRKPDTTRELWCGLCARRVARESFSVAQRRVTDAAARFCMLHKPKSVARARGTTLMPPTGAARAAQRDGGDDDGDVHDARDESNAWYQRDATLPARDTRWQHQPGARHPSCKPVQQLDPDTGAVVNTWPSATIAARALRLRTTAGISMCVHGKIEFAGGFRWRLAGDDDIVDANADDFRADGDAKAAGGASDDGAAAPVPTHARGIAKGGALGRGSRPMTASQRRGTVTVRGGPSKPIQSLDPETGEVVRTWPSGSMAARALGIDQAAISKALHGHTAVAHGFRWRFLKGVRSYASSQCSGEGERETDSEHESLDMRDNDEDEEDDDATADRRTPPLEGDPSASDDDDERCSGLGAPTLESVMSGAAALLRTSTRPEGSSVGSVNSSATLACSSADMTGLLTTLAEAAEAAEPDLKRPRLMSCE